MTGYTADIDHLIDHLIELRGVYDGWSIAVLKDGTLRNRWAKDDGTAAVGYERRWAATEDAIAAMSQPTDPGPTGPAVSPTA